MSACIHIYIHVNIYISKGWSSPPWPNHRIHGNRAELRHSPQLDRLDRFDIFQRDQKPLLCARFKNPFSLSLVPFPLLLCCGGVSRKAEKSFSTQKFATLEIGSAALPSLPPSFLPSFEPRNDPLLGDWFETLNPDRAAPSHPVAKSLHSCPSTELNISTPREDYYPSNAEYRKSLGETGSTYTRRAFRSTGHNRSRLPCILPPSPSPPLSTLYTLHPLLSSRYSSLLPPRGGLGGGAVNRWKKKIDRSRTRSRLLSTHSRGTNLVSNRLSRGKGWRRSRRLKTIGAIDGRVRIVQ